MLDQLIGLSFDCLLIISFVFQGPSRTVIDVNADGHLQSEIKKTTEVTRSEMAHRVVAVTVIAYD